MLTTFEAHTRTHDTRTTRGQCLWGIRLKKNGGGRAGKGPHPHGRPSATRLYMVPPHSPPRTLVARHPSLPPSLTTSPNNTLSPARCSSSSPLLLTTCRTTPGR